MSPPSRNYDLLSDTGKRQSALLGQFVRKAGIKFRAAFAGAMRRQQETGALVLGEMPDAPPLDERIDLLSRLNSEGREEIRTISAEIRRTL